MATVKLQRIEGRNPQTKERYYYVQTKATGTMSASDLVENIVKEQRVPELYAEGVLKYLAKAVFDYMKAGMAVQVPGLGTLKLNVSSKAMAAEADATAQTVTGVKLQLIPTQEMRREMQSFRFELVEGIQPAEPSEEEVPAGSGEGSGEGNGGGEPPVLS